MRGNWIALLLLGCAQAIYMMKPVPKPALPVWRDEPIVGYAVPTVEPLPTVSPRPKMERTLEQCCGKVIASIGPAFGGIELGRGAVEVVMGHDPRVRRDTLGLVVHAYGGEGEHGIYLDGLDIDVPYDDLCDELESRLQHKWGPGDEWTRSRQGARLHRTGLRDPASTACTLSFFRIPSSDPAHCLDDEGVITAHVADLKRHVVSRDRPVGCELVRDRTWQPHDRGICSVDDKHQKYYLALEQVGDRLCTPHELDQIMNDWSSDADYMNKLDMVIFNP